MSAVSRIRRRPARPLRHTFLTSLWYATEVLRFGGVIAYATEGVFGLGVDPKNAQAMARLLAIKARSPRKGIILIAASAAQLKPWLGSDPCELAQLLVPCANAPTTWVVPAANNVPDWLTGGRKTLAVRVAGHPQVVALCQRFGGPIVSTSANRQGRNPARTQFEATLKLGRFVDYVLPGRVGEATGPSEIRDGLTGEVIRSAGLILRPKTGDSEDA